jgi:excisionase family DNA binding protein
MPPSLDTHFVSVATAAEILSVSVSHVYALVRSAELPALRVGSRGPWRISTTVLEHFIAQQYSNESVSARWRESQWAGIADIADGRRL